MATIEERYISCEDSLKAYRDIRNSINTAKKEGRAEGLAEGRAEGRNEEKIAIARKMKSKGFSVTDISEMTGLSDEEIEGV